MAEADATANAPRADAAAPATPAAADTTLGASDLAEPASPVGASSSLGGTRRKRVDNKEKEQLLDVFHQWDRNDDGGIGLGDLRIVMSRLGFKPQEVSKLFAEVDENSDGIIDFEEFVNWLFCDDEEAQIVKSNIYRSHDPMAELEEFMKFVGQLKEQKDEKGRSQKLKDIFDALDHSGNGTISMTEFVGGVKSLGYACDDDSLHEIFKLIDTEVKRVKKPKAPELPAGSDPDADPYAAAGVPDMRKEVVPYRGFNEKLIQQEAVVHDPYRGVGPHTKRRDHVISFKEFKKAFKQISEPAPASPAAVAAPAS